jgi:hypothetical protein
MANQGCGQTPDLEVASDIGYDQYPFRRIFKDDYTEESV